ncbi:hypothetical protein BGZ68_000612 [Mortierella alpina]|nr:hypothetical protein BGZ68_000612 [Mortierella alpina]
MDSEPAERNESGSEQELYLYEDAAENDDDDVDDSEDQEDEDDNDNEDAEDEGHFFVNIGNMIESDDDDDDDYEDEDDDDEDAEGEGGPLFNLVDLFANAEPDREKGLELINSGEFGRVESAYIPARELKKNVARKLWMRELKSRKINPLSLGESILPDNPGKVVDVYDESACSGQYSEDGSLFASCDKDWKLRIYKTAGNKLILEKQIQGIAGLWTITDHNLSLDNDWLIYSSITPYVHLTRTAADAPDAHHRLDFSTGDEDNAIWSVRFSGDGREIVAGGRGRIYVYDIESRTVLHSVAAHKNDVNSVCFAEPSSSQVVFSGSDDHTVKVWDRRSMGAGRHSKPSGVLVGHAEGITYVTSKGDNRYLASNGKDQKMLLWDLRMMRSNKDYEKLPRYQQSDFDYRSERYTGSKNRKVEGDCSVMSFQGHKVLRTLIRCHFSPAHSTGQRYLYTGSADGMVHIYRLDGTLVRKLDTAEAFQRLTKSQAPTSYVARDVSWHPYHPTILSSCLADHFSYSDVSGGIVQHKFTRPLELESDMSEVSDTDVPNVHLHSILTPRLMENSDNSAQRQSPNASDNSLGNSNSSENTNSTNSTNNNGTTSESTTAASKAAPSPETTATSSTSTSTATTTTAGTSPERTIPSATQPTSTPQPATASSDAAPINRGTEFWCHQCQREITPVMMPDPLCPHCYGEFVEKIEADNDPRAFAQTAPQQHPGQADGLAPALNEPVNLDDLFRLFQALANPHRAMQQQQQQQQQQPQQQRIPGQMYSTQFVFNSGPTTTTRTFSTSTEPGASLGQQPPGAGDQNTQPGQGAQGTQGPQWHSPPSFISGLLSRLGIEVHYSTDPAAALSGQGFGGPMAMGGGNAPMLFPLGGGFPPMVGNPGDYAWGQGALDDIITQMMDLQNRQHGPVGATEDAINNIPHHKLTEEELGKDAIMAHSECDE